MVFAALLGVWAGCSTNPKIVNPRSWSDVQYRAENLNTWLLSGRINITYDSESHTPRVRWSQMGENFDIRLWGTFNIGNTLLAGNSTGVTITQDGQTKAAETPEKLLLEFLGYEVPVSYMHYWIRGIPSPTSQAQILYSENEQLAQITQNEWVIDYVDFRQYGDFILPRRIEANHERRKIKLRLIGLRWEIDKDA